MRLSVVCPDDLDYVDIRFPSMGERPYIYLSENLIVRVIVVFVIVAMVTVLLVTVAFLRSHLLRSEQLI